MMIKQQNHFGGPDFGTNPDVLAWMIENTIMSMIGMIYWQFVGIYKLLHSIIMFGFVS